jgi:hypothetical protein
MSWQAKVRQLCEAGKLHLVEPPLGESAKRCAFLSEALWRRFEQANINGTPDAERLASVWAMLQSFVAGKNTSFAMNPLKKSTHAMIARNAPTQLGIVDFRCLAPRPGMRLFGGFFETDCFIGVRCYGKDDTDRLGFNACVKDSRAAWDTLFGNGFGPQVYSKAIEYVSANVLSE